uniref:RRM domain-containing protein n=1 Tax=Setaria digitata TaxID=48799 RepID=A0A915PV78_9BILA
MSSDEQSDKEACVFSSPFADRYRSGEVDPESLLFRVSRAFSGILLTALSNCRYDIFQCPLCMEPLEIDDINFYPCKVLQKNLVYVVGLSARVADPETLKKPEYFGKYGRILKVAVGSSPTSNGPQSASCTAYVTYARYEDALRAIQAVNNAQLDGRIVKASLGTTKYCTNFLRSQPCYKPECMYLHDVADTEVSFTKDDMHLGRHAEYEKRLIESTLREKSQRGRASFITNTGGKPSKSESTERGPDCRSSVGNSQDKQKIPQSRSSSNDKSTKKIISQANGEVPRNQPCSATINKLIGENKGADKENEVSHVLVSLIDDAGVDQCCFDYLFSGHFVGCDLSLIKRWETQMMHRRQQSLNSMQWFLRQKSRLSEWISSSQGVVPLIATTCGSIEKMFLNDCVNGEVVPSWAMRYTEWPYSCYDDSINLGLTVMKLNYVTQDVTIQDIGLSAAKDKVDVSSTKALSNSNNSSQSVSDTGLCDWQRALGICGKESLTSKSVVTDFSTSLSSSQTRVLPKSTRLSVHSDDDLGFDPISESAKGLADLLEEEKTVLPHVGGMASVSSLMSLGMQCGWPSMGVSNGASPMSMRNLLGTDVDLTAAATHNYSCTSADCFSQPLKLSSQTAQTLTQQLSSVFHTNQFSSHPYFPPSKPQMARVNSFVNPPTNLTFSSAHPQRCPSFNSNTQYHPNVSLAAANQIDGTKLHEWQEGFRALLPNVNVRFVPDLNTAGYPSSRTSPMEMQRTTNHQFSSALNYDQTMPMSTQLLNPMASSAPPPVASMSSYSHPAQQWMMPPPGFSYVSKR